MAMSADSRIMGQTDGATQVLRHFFDEPVWPYMTSVSQKRPVLSIIGATDTRRGLDFIGFCWKFIGLLVLCYCVIRAANR
jgi:hypothetical protein